ncbi:MFS transporter [Jannaschia sp. CCS1]|uniref:MFS transporter n=1 Tax=Jannaschia sp. (strain CCS1) TaxID=290400 RepID=UPI000053B7DE|nr:MFS transporter [Jannaschia sp. CCS1]ABD52949.1 major facilitator superfamily MFS_1 [Jannaschia sp. CCS1]
MTSPPDAPEGSVKRLIQILSVTNFVIGMGAFMVIGMLPPMAESLEMSTAGSGWIMTIYAISYAIASPLLVSSTGGIGRRKVLFLGLAVFTLANLLAAIAPSGAVVLIARAFAAAGAGMVTPVAAAVVAGVVAPERRAKSLAAVFFGLTLAQVIGVPAGSYIAYSIGWRYAFILVTLLALPCLWLIWTRVPRGLRFQPVGLRDLSAVLADWRIMLAVLFTATFLAAIYVPFTYIAPLMEAHMGFGRDGISSVLLTFGLAAVVGNLLGGWMSDRFGPTPTLMLLAITQVLLMPFLSFLPMAAWMVFALIFTWSIFGWSFTAPQQARVISLAPDRAPVVLSLNAAAIYVGAAVGASVGGAAISQSGLLALGWVGGAMALVGVAHLLVSARISR